MKNEKRVRLDFIIQCSQIVKILCWGKMNRKKNESMQRDTGANAEFQVVKLEKWSNKTSNPNLDSNAECKIQIYL